MTTEEEKQELLVSLERVLEHKGKELVNRKEWGAINFEQIRHDIESVFRIATELVDLPLEYLPTKIAVQLTGDFHRVAKSLSQINSFKIESIADPTSQRSNICVNLQQQFQNLLTAIAPFLPFLVLRQGEFLENVQAIKKSNDEVQEILSGAKEWVKLQENTVENIVQNAREASSSVGIERFAPAFKDEAKDLGDRSKIWLRVTGGLAATTIVAAIIFYFYPAAMIEGTGNPLQKFLSKAAIIAILFTGTIWCGRIYRTLAHQATVNRHRALSLETFQTFVEGTKDPQIKDAVLMAATNTVFANVPTGFVEPSGDQENKVNLVELSKSFKSDQSQ